MARSKLREYFHVDYQPGERLLLRKLDFFILTFCCLSYFMNYVFSINRLLGLHFADLNVAGSLQSGERICLGHERRAGVCWQSVKCY